MTLAPEVIERTAFAFEVRDVAPPARRPFTTIEGRAVPYDTYANVGPYLERFKRDAFKKSISESARPLPLMLFHGRDDLWPIGVATRWQSKDDGLWGQWRLNDSANAQRAAEMAESGELGYLSVGFIPIRSVPDDTVADYNPALGEDHMDRLTRVEARLVETSIVPSPAYAEAEITLVRAYHRPPGPEQQARLKAWRAEEERLRSTLS
jgi:HK97 family phage prohead protease